VSGRTILVGLSIGFCSVVTPASSAFAQRPLCPAPTAEDSYYLTCRPGTTDRVAAFLYDFSVRHLLKSSDTFSIQTSDVLDVLDLQKILDPANPDVKTLLDVRPAIDFTPLDRSTGEFLSKGPTGPQTLKASNDQLGIALELTIPEVVQGLYWRSPAHLELQFYKGHGIRFHLSGPKVTEFEETLQCISITGSRARATTGDPTHRYLATFFETCP
jgi:hypothetical protein